MATISQTGKAPAVSWQITVRNGERYLPETLEAIRNQTFTDYEVLVWLVESTDRTEQVLEEWIPHRLPGTIFRSGPCSIGAARAELVVRARGEFCAIIDADDLSTPTRLERQVAFLRAHPEIDLVGSQLRLIDGNGAVTGGQIRYPLSHDDILHGFLVGNTIGQPSVLCRRTAILEAGNYNPDARIEDYDLWLRLAAKRRLANLADTLVDYRFYPLSNTRQLEKAGLAQRQIDGELAQNAPALFGIDVKTAWRLRERRQWLSIFLAVRIARHLSRTQGGGFWQRLRSPSLIDALAHLSHPWDICSVLLLGMVNSRRHAFLQACDHLVRKALQHRPFSCFAPAYRQAKLSRWIKNQNRRGCFIDHRLEVTGATHARQSIHVGRGTIIERDVTIWISADPGAAPRLDLAEDVFIGRNTYLGMYAPVSIGRHTMIGAFSYVISGNHSFQTRDVPIREQGFVGGPIEIGEDVWIGTHVVILPGLSIGRGAIIGAGSVVNRSVGEFEIWAGTPARFIKNRP